MAGGKEIRTKISSVQSTQKITRAMEMVAASKMRKAQQRMLETRPYSDKIQRVISHIANAQSEYQHTFFQSRPVKTVGLVVVATDRGLCGGLNINLFRHLVEQIMTWQEQGIEVKLSVIGAKGLSFFKRLNCEILASTTHLGDNPSISDVIGPVAVMLRSFEEQGIDSLYLAYNKFINTMSQSPQVMPLLPISPEAMEVDEKEVSKSHWDYIYEPEAKELLDSLLTRFIESQVYQGAVENFASEQAARMVAMKSATDNAGTLIDDLKLVYNKARQAAITQELSEIVGGAAAV